MNSVTKKRLAYEDSPYDVSCEYCGAPTVELQSARFRSLSITENRIRRMKKKWNISFSDVLRCERTMDHRLPKSKGGTNNENNLAICCKLCNQTKSNYYSAESFEKAVQKWMIRGNHHSERVCRNVPYVVEAWKRLQEEEEVDE